jgi:hypothetical protein
MTAPSPATLEREKGIDDGYVTDAEIIRLMRVPEKTMRATIKGLDANPRSGFPKKDPLFGGRRYLPAVQKWFHRYNGLEPQGGPNDHRKTA